MGRHPGSAERCGHTCSVSGECTPTGPSPSLFLPDPTYFAIHLHGLLTCPIYLSATLQACCAVPVVVLVVAASVQQINGVLQLAEGQDVYQLLGSPYQDLWLHWLDEGNEAYKQQAKNSNQERLDFVRSVVAAAAANNAAASQSDSAEPTDTCVTTHELPKVSVRVKLTGCC